MGHRRRHKRRHHKKFDFHRYRFIITGIIFLLIHYYLPKIFKPTGGLIERVNWAISIGAYIELISLVSLWVGIGFIIYGIFKALK